MNDNTPQNRRGMKRWLLPLFLNCHGHGQIFITFWVQTRSRCSQHYEGNLFLWESLLRFSHANNLYIIILWLGARIRIKWKRFLVACYATLHPALSVPPSVGRSVCPSVHPSHFTFLGFFWGGDFWLHCSCPNDLGTSITAPAHPHATGVAVYPALFDCWGIYDNSTH